MCRAAGAGADPAWEGETGDPAIDRLADTHLPAGRDLQGQPLRSVRNLLSYERTQEKYHSEILRIADAAKVACLENPRPVAKILTDPVGTKCERCPLKIQMVEDDPTVWECSLTMLLRWLGDPDSELAEILEEESRQPTVKEINQMLDEWDGKKNSELPPAMPEHPAVDVMK
jgi:hypothetical protein